MKSSMNKPLALLASIIVSTACAQAGQVVVSNFDDPNDATLWAWESWSATAVAEPDSTLDAGGGAAGSGSMRVTCSFTDNPGGYNQSVVSLALGADVDAETLYTNISFDLRMDPSSYPRVDGVNYGGVELIFRNGSSDWNSLGLYQLKLDNTNWTHMNFPVKAPGNAVHHLTIKLGENNLTNTVIFNVDNIRWDEAATVLPPPVMAIQPTKPRLNFLAASSGQYDRQNIATVASDFGWINLPVPMSYSMTISDFPSAATFGGFSAHFYIVPGIPTGSDPDWGAANCILVDIAAAADGSGTANFRYKTNAPGSNGINNQYFNNNPAAGPVGFLGSVKGANILGTWTITLNQNTNITLTAPDGTTKDMVMPLEDALQFDGPATVYFGIMPGQNANIGQTAILSGAQIKAGSNVLVTDNFTTSPLNPDVWVSRSASTAGVTMITTNEPYWVSWTTPSSGFTLQTNATLNPAGWGDASITDQLVGTRKRALIPSSVLPGANQGYFRLLKP